MLRHFQTLPVWHPSCCDNRGCTMRYPNDRIEVYCADGDYECLAHELRHVADPMWQHDLDHRSVSAK